MRSAKYALFAIACCVACGGDDREARGPDDVVEVPKFRVRSTTGTASYPYALYVPPDYESRPDWPLIVFVHGWGERGSDGQAPASVGIGPAVLANPERFPALVLAPQVPRTVEGERAMERHYQVIQAAVDSSVVSERELDIAIAGLTRDAYPRIVLDAAFDDVVQSFNVDEDRIYLTGISLGGMGAWAYAVANPTRFAAMTLIGAGGDSRLATYLPHVPIRFYHGARDEVVPPFNSVRLADALRNAGGFAELNLIPGRGHNVWDDVYADDEAIDWIFDKRL